MGNASKVPTDPKMSGEVRSFLDTAQKSLDDLDAFTDTLGTAAFLDVGTAANKIVQLDSGAKLPAIDGSQLTNLPVQAPAGRLEAGAPLVLNPYANSTTAAQAHGLAVEPALLAISFECLNATQNYSAGDKIRWWGGYIAPWVVLCDTTNVVLVTSTTTPQIPNKTTHISAAINVGDWKLTITPYKLT